MTREEAILKWIVPAIKNTWNERKCKEILKAIEQEPFINKPCVSKDVCEHDKNVTLDKIRAEIEQEYNRLSATRADETLEVGECLGLKMALKIIDKYKAESEVQNDLPDPA